MIRVKGFIPVGILLGSSLIYLSFFFDAHLRHHLQGYLSRLNGQAVTIGRLSTNFIRGEITVNQIEIWFPGFVKRTLKVGQVKFTVDQSALFFRKIIIDKITAEGVVFGPASRDLAGDASIGILSGGGISLIDRISNGFHNDLRKQIGDNPFRKIGILLSGLDLAVEVQKKAKHLQSLKILESYDQALVELNTDLKKIADEIPDLATFVPPSVKEGKAGTEVEMTADSTDIDLPRVNAAEKSISETVQKMEARFKNTHDELKKFRNVVDKDIDSFKSDLSLPRIDGKDLTPVLAGGTLAKLLGQLNYWVDLSRRKMPRGSERKAIILSGSNDPYQGTSVHFSSALSVPSMWVKQVELRPGPATPDGVTGSASNLTTDPALVGKPMELSLAVDFPKENIRGVRLTMQVDHRHPVLKESIRFQAERIPLENVVISEAGDFNLSLKSAFAKVDFSADFDEDTLKARLASDFENVEYASSSRYKRIQDTVMNALSGLNHFNLEADIQGPFDELKLHTSSELGMRVAGALGPEFQHQVGAIEDDLRKNILDVVFPRHQKQIIQLIGIKERWLTPAQDRFNLAQALRRRAEKLIAQSKPRRALAGSQNNVKKSSSLDKPARPVKK